MASKDFPIVVTGAGGFIGGHLINYFRSQGYRDIRAADIKPLDEWYQVFRDVKNYAGPLKGDCRLGTSGGKVTAVVEKSVAFDLDASTSGGDVSATGMTITIDKGGVGRSRLAGKVNGGGPLLKLRTSGGNIRIEPR